jgi:hypothetical protein
MTSHDHNKTLGIIYLGLGGLVIVGTVVMLPDLSKGFTAIVSNADDRTLIISGLLLLVILIPTAYGLFKRRPWARFSTLVLSGLLVFLFPLGTALAIYTWWFMHSEGGKLLYRRSAS